jgi:hypothetical protein
MPICQQRLGVWRAAGIMGAECDGSVLRAIAFSIILPKYLRWQSRPVTSAYLDRHYTNNFQHEHHIAYWTNVDGAEPLGIVPRFSSSTGLRYMRIVGHDRHTMGLPLLLRVSRFEIFQGIQLPMTSSRFITCRP